MTQEEIAKIRIECAKIAKEYSATIEELLQNTQKILDMVLPNY